MTRERAPNVVSPRKTPVTAVTIPVVTRDQLSQITIRVQAELGRRVSMAAAFKAALAMAQADPDGFRETLRAQLEEGTDAP